MGSTVIQQPKSKHMSCLSSLLELVLNTLVKLATWELLKLDPRQKYLASWQRILNKSGDTCTCSPNLKDYKLLDIHVPVQTASLEGVSLMKRVKNDWRSQLLPATVIELMSVELNVVLA